MQKRSREIIALVMLVVLLVGGVSAFAWYIFVGHNWNEAASNIDDHVGDMEGYMVVLYDGTVPSKLDQYAESASQPLIDAQSLGDLDETDAQPPDEDAVSLTLPEAVDSYREKEAAVVTLHVDDPRGYEDPVIVTRNGSRIAIFSVGGPRPELASRIMLKKLAHMDVDFTICLLDDLDTVKRGLGRVNVAVCTGRENAGLKGHYIGATYTVGAAYEGVIEAVVVSPSGFLSSKVLEGV